MKFFYLNLHVYIKYYYFIMASKGFFDRKIINIVNIGYREGEEFNSFENECNIGIKIETSRGDIILVIDEAPSYNEIIGYSSASDFKIEKLKNAKILEIRNSNTYSYNDFSSDSDNDSFSDSDDVDIKTVYYSVFLKVEYENNEIEELEIFVGNKHDGSLEKKVIFIDNEKRKESFI